MTTVNPASYLVNRKQWGRPQGILFANAPGTLQPLNPANPTQDLYYVPTGFEKIQDPDFLILSDHNRAPIEISAERIEDRKRMINGTMRSYFIANKFNMSTSWSNLPSRSSNVASPRNFDGRLLPINPGSDTPIYPTLYTVDGGAGGSEIVEWYENHPGPFWVFLAYDRPDKFTGNDRFNQIQKYNEVKLMYINSFSYSVTKRGQDLMDLWDVSISLEEV